MCKTSIYLQDYLSEILKMAEMEGLTRPEKEGRWTRSERETEREIYVSRTAIQMP